MNFCQEHKIPDVHLRTVTHEEANIVFASHTVWLALGHSLLLKSIKSGTIRQCTRVAAEFVQKGHRQLDPNTTFIDPRNDMITGKKCADIKSIEDEVAH